ncbi:MAG: hypothetical protein IKE74_04500 [Mogibacterium sp.]|nr:hypothetical protein [Mogibacterium sp.]
MENSYNAPREIEIDLADLIWKLLMQWKAMLLVCIAMALLIPGIKYAKDSSAYKAELADKKKAEEEASKPVEDRIDAALKLLPADQREDVLFVVQQQDMVDVQKEYLNNSILMNTDPANQRQLALKFVLKSDNGTDMRTLANSYSTYLHRADTLESLREIISPDTDIVYIEELIDTRNEDIWAGDVESAMYTISITLPDDVDADRIVELIDSEVDEFHDEINSSVGEHSIFRVNVEDRSVFNKDMIDRRANLTYTINNLNSSIDSAKGKLSVEQQAACESIVAIKQSSGSVQESVPKEETSSSDTQKPGFSKKYAVLGFALGAFLYAGIFVVLLVLKKVVASASTAQSYTDTRLLGEVYRRVNHKGLRWLLSSDVVASWRYKDKLDSDKQISALAATVDAVCAHHGIDKLTMILSGVDNVFDDIVDRIVTTCSSENNKISINLVNADKMDEKTLGSVKNAIYMLCSKSKVDNLGNLISLIKDYDVTPLGTVYLEEL